MAQISIMKKATVLVVAALAAAATVSAQELSPSLAPSPDAGAAFSVPASGVMIGASLVLDLAFKNTCYCKKNTVRIDFDL
ncbi:hypothetical protein L1987_13814 [Smallanthus sonchifolius]|uniref:Uncharacterized protein n=1 Tax=Smallanthus sonchifolius TaxID=185202 RepID=A0ACB9JI39_9ASTR|nr:hypothetical protein L1987_13814 [Smallanthus sonchifolius]